ncbi:hypothetical protein REPUB_Repub11eG0057300 [Reevesia pubescens]
MDGLPTQNISALALPGFQQNQVSAITTPAAESKPKKKICCACPETKKLRDECIVEHGEEACAKWIEAHRIKERYLFLSIAVGCIATVHLFTSMGLIGTARILSRIRIWTERGLCLSWFLE